MILLCLQVLLSLAVLLYSAEKFVEGAAGSARFLGLSPFLIGVFILGFGTSAPEILVSVLSAMKGNPGVALGNAYGSNIANIGLVLGLTAMMKPITVLSKTLYKEMSFLVFVTLLTPFLFWDQTLGLFESILLLGFFAFFVGWMLWTHITSPAVKGPFHEESKKEIERSPLSPLKAFLFLGVGGLMLVISSKYLVEAAVDIARLLNVSDLVIGLTLVAVGTSLPELFSSLVAIRKNEHALAFGNVIGSNLLNTLVVVGIAGIIKPFKADPEVLFRDLPLMVAATLALITLRLWQKTKNQISRLEGGLYFTIYILYMLYLGLSAGSPQSP